jgi:hypothetical protein
MPRLVEQRSSHRTHTQVYTLQRSCSTCKWNESRYKNSSPLGQNNYRQENIKALQKEDSKSHVSCFNERISRFTGSVEAIEKLVNSVTKLLLAIITLIAVILSISSLLDGHIDPITFLNKLISSLSVIGFAVGMKSFIKLKKI